MEMSMRTLILVAVALALAGCSTVTNMAHSTLDGAKPRILIDRDDGKAYLLLMGLPIVPPPLRMPQEDVQAKP